MKTLEQTFSLWSKVESQGINEADVARGMPGDIMCYGDDDSLRLVIEVKDRTLTLTDVDATVKKVLLHGESSHLLFTAPGFAETDRKDIEEHIASAWVKGMNIHHISLDVLIRSVFVLMPEECRIGFLREVGAELDLRPAL